MTAKTAQAIKTEYHFMSHTDSDYHTDRLEEIKQKFLDEGDLLGALMHLQNGEKYAHEMYQLSKDWMNAFKEGKPESDLLKIAIDVFSKINASMDVAAQDWAIEAFKEEQEKQANEWPDDEAPYKGEYYERVFSQAA